VTLPSGDINPQYIYPGSHMVSTSQGPDNLPLGARLRLKNNDDVNNIINSMSLTAPESKIIARAMQRYGLVVADIGSAMYISGASGSMDANNNLSQTWDLNDIFASNGLETLNAGDFQVVNLTPIVTGLSASSGVANSTLMIHGQNFSGAAGNLSVFFGSVPSNSVTPLSDTLLSVVVPSGVGTVDVTVQSGVNETDYVSSSPNANVNAPIFGYGTSATTSADNFTFIGGEYWTNQALTLKWTDALNWTPTGVPNSTNDVIFANTGLSNGVTVNLNGAQAARSLALQGNVSFTLGGSGGLMLATGAITRSPGASGTQTIAQPVILDANGTWDIAGSGELVVADAVSGPFSLTKQNTGTLTLSGSNTYSQGTIVTGGTLVVSNENAILSGSNLTVGSSALSLLASPVALIRPGTLLAPLTPPQTQRIIRLSVSEDGEPFPRLPVGLQSDGSVNLVSSVSGVSAPALHTTEVVKSLLAGAADTPRIEPFSRSSAAKAIAADLAGLQGASSSDDLDHSREKDVAILALEALFADYGG